MTYNFIDRTLDLIFTEGIIETELSLSMGKKGSHLISKRVKRAFPRPTPQYTKIK